MEEQISNTPPQPTFPTDGKDLIFCLSMLITGLAMGNFIIYGGFNLGFAIAAVVSIVCSAAYLHRSGHKADRYSAAVLVLCILIAAGFARSDDGFVKYVLFHFLLVGVNLSLCLMAGQNRHSSAGVHSLLDAPATLVLRGCGRIPPALRGVVNAFRNSGTLGQRSGAILVGLALAIPALLVVIPLLMRSDAAFEGLLELLPDFDLKELMCTAVVGGLLSLVLYTRGIALHRDAKPEPPAPKTRKGLNALTMNTALGAVCLVYVVYLLSQLAYFVGGFSGILPQGYSTAEYARRGFFEMALLCAINLGLITFGVAMVAKQTKAPRSTRILCGFIGAVTLFLVCASCAKMVLYISVYGLTRLRVLTMVIMLFLAVTTTLVCVWLFVPRLQYMKGVMLTALILGALIIWADVDTQVARCNVNAYLSGTLETVDVYYLSTLSDGALPHLARLTTCDDPAVSQQAAELLQMRYEYRIQDFRDWNYVNHIASSMAEQIIFSPPSE